MKIYLAGSVPKGDKEAIAFHNWRIVYTQVMRQKFKDTSVIDPYDPAVNENDFLAVVGADTNHIKESDLVIVNAEEKLGAGTAMEIVIAKYFHIPVITILPKNSHHRRSNLRFHNKIVADWIHPFIHTFSDFTLENISQIRNIKLERSKIKNMEIIDKAITHYKNVTRE